MKKDTKSQVVNTTTRSAFKSVKNISTLKCLATILTAIILTVSTIATTNLVTFASVNTQVPTVATITAEAQATASYVLSADASDLSTLSTTSSFHNVSRDLILATQSGLDTNSEIATYLNTVNSLLNSDGTLNLECSNGYILVNYAELLDILALAGYDATNYNGLNIVSVFNNAIKSVSSTNLSDSSYLNPYLIGIIYATVESYSDLLTDYSAIKENLVTAIKSITTTNGVTYYGNSADNDGNVLPAFATLYDEDSEFANTIDSIVTIHQTTYYDSETGAVNAWGSLNPDSTALSLAFSAQYADSTTAAAKYNALLSNFKSSTTDGAYTYGGDDSIYSSRDALIGLVTYLNTLKGLSNPFYVTPITSISTNTTADTVTNTSDNETDATITTTTVTETTDSLSSPKTADNSYVVFFFILMLASVSTTTFAVKIRK